MQEEENMEESREEQVDVISTHEFKNIVIKVGNLVVKLAFYND